MGGGFRFITVELIFFFYRMAGGTQATAGLESLVSMNCTGSSDGRLNNQMDNSHCHDVFEAY